jgi:hypothetical protein
VTAIFISGRPLGELTPTHIADVEQRAHEQRDEGTSADLALDALAADVEEFAPLSARTFCTFPREFSSFRRQG